MSAAPASIAVARQGAYYLAPFDRSLAPLVAQWAPDPLDLFWLAPKTFPPLSAAKVLAWTGPQDNPLLFYHHAAADPLGYLELNPMPGEPRHMWLGHCVITQEHRGIGLGQLMIRLALDEAFLQRGAQRVSLVVFPDNAAAVGCYRRCGFLVVGEQRKYFYTTGRDHQMLQMSIAARGYRADRQMEPADAPQ